MFAGRKHANDRKRVYALSRARSGLSYFFFLSFSFYVGPRDPDLVSSFVGRPDDDVARRTTITHERARNSPRCDIARSAPPDVTKTREGAIPVANPFLRWHADSRR